MDVYDLILQKGTLNALKYAQSIERTNYRLASEIDDAVIDVFNKFSQSHIGTYDYAPVATPQPRQQTQSLHPLSNPEIDELHRKEQTPGDAGNFWLKVTGDLIKYGYNYRLIINMMKKFQINNLKIILEKIPTASNQTQLIEEASNIIAKLPSNPLIPGAKSLRELALQSVKNSGLSSDIGNNIVHEVAGNLSKITKPVGGGLFNRAPSVLESMHPTLGNQGVLDNFRQAVVADTGTLGLSAAEKNVKVLSVMNEIKGKNPQEIVNILKNNGLNTAANEAESFFGIGTATPGTAIGAAGEGLNASEQIAKETSSAGEGVTGTIIKLLAKVFPGIEEWLPKILPWLGPIAAIFEAKGLIEEFNEYGMDKKTACDAAGMITSVLALIPGTQEFTLPITLAVHGFCFAAELFGGMKHDEKTSKTHGGKLITLDDIKKAAGEASFNSLDSNDQKIIQNLYSQYKDDESRLSEEVNKAKNSNQFHDALHAVAVVYNALHTDHNAIPALPSPATSPSAPSTTSRSRYIFRPVYAA
jgi:hypothetical protein